MRLLPRRLGLPRKKGKYGGPVVFAQDGWHYPADKVGNVRFQLVAEPVVRNVPVVGLEGRYAATVTTWRFASADDRNHNAIHEERIVELGVTPPA